MPTVKNAPPGSVLIASTVKLDSAGLTDVGQERGQNQDQFLVATLQRTLQLRGSSVENLAQRWLPNSTEGTIMLVADGMGGVEGGEIASTVALQTIVEYVCAVMPWAEASLRRESSPSPASTMPGVKTGLHKAFAVGDAEVKKAAESGGANMGTTVTMTYLLWPSLYVAHVGDSRCYLLRNGELTQLTTDHTMAEKLKQASDIDLDESSPWHHVLWNAIGGGKHAAMEPEVHRHHLMLGDVILLCSDGLTKHATDPEIANALQKSPNAEEACERLVAMANAGGGSDNITVVVARCKPFENLQVDSEAPTMVRKRP
jgi:serine/threonine protein phosphatase PrpC